MKSRKVEAKVYYADEKADARYIVKFWLVWYAVTIVYLYVKSGAKLFGSF